jgi:hypothetical protein
VQVEGEYLFRLLHLAFEKSFSNADVFLLHAVNIIKMKGQELS